LKELDLDALIKMLDEPKRTPRLCGFAHDGHCSGFLAFLHDIGTP
jgi:hypothetical protein